MAKNKEEKLASNFELNFLKLGKHTFQLEKGDHFWTNGNVFVYEPIGGENRNKLPFSGYRQARTISCKKYEKDILRADNIELVEERPGYSDPKENAERNKDGRYNYKKWEVKYAYKMPEVEKDQLHILIITKNSYPKTEKDFYEYNVAVVTVERETEQQLFVNPYNPMNAHSRIEKKELNVVQSEWRGLYIITKFDDYHEAEIALFKAYEEKLKEAVESAKKHLEASEIGLKNFDHLKRKQGFIK
jgi:hypothetical protein